MQIDLYGEDIAKKIMEADKDRPYDEKILNKVIHNFIDIKTGYIVKFYETEKLYEHWSEYVNKD